LVKLGKFTGDVLQTQVEETIQEALKTSELAKISHEQDAVFDAHGLSMNVQPSKSLEAQASKTETDQVQCAATAEYAVYSKTAHTPQASKTETDQVQSAPTAEHAVSSKTVQTPTYSQTEFLSSDSKIVIKRLVELSVGAAFGEIALENANSKRTATIVAETDCKLISITRADYRNVLADLFSKKKASDIAFLKNVPIFSKLNPRTLETLQSVMTYQTYLSDKGDAT
jgi:CRP-like cAMP-binding protein